jgi:hypothetical protein
LGGSTTRRQFKKREVLRLKLQIKQQAKDLGLTDEETDELIASSM